MKSLPIGERIKELRLSKKMTQQEVVGDHITRNMLSKIENNSATPSVRTLEYIAGKLGVPPGVLLSENERLPEEDNDPAGSISCARCSFLDAAREAYRSNQYEKCLLIIHTAFGGSSGVSADDSVHGDDEARLLAAMACLSLSERAFAAADTDAIIRYSEECIKYNRSGMYYNPTLEAKASMLLKSTNESH